MYCGKIESYFSRCYTLYKKKKKKQTLIINNNNNNKIVVLVCTVNYFNTVSGKTKRLKKNFVGTESLAFAGLFGVNQ